LIEFLDCKISEALGMFRSVYLIFTPILIDTVKDSLPKCDRCNSPVTDSIKIEIENHGKVKLGKYTYGSWVCNDCLTKRASEEKYSTP